MEKINAYWQQLSPEEIRLGKHREMVGGMWDEIGLLQLEFLKRQGLLPEHNLLDVGCGSLRGGIHFVEYLQPGRYFGFDINASLIEAGRMELSSRALSGKQPQLLINENFEFWRYGAQFDFALAVSVFTHLFINHISRCLAEACKVLKPNGKFYATFFRAPHSVHFPPIRHSPGNVTTFHDSDPFHYSFDELRILAENANFSVELIEDWEHPRAQKMLCFTNRQAVKIPNSRS
jgi:SAM-dependent methyltransferase